MYKKRGMNFMGTNKTVEKKAIIFVTDVVAYSKHIEQDQVGALTSLAACETTRSNPDTYNFYQYA